MTEPEWRHEDELSLFALGTIVLRSRWRIALWMFIGAVIAVVSVLSSSPQYRASTSFIPQGYDASRSGLATLAGQFGVAVSGPMANQSLSPDFYINLVRSRVILAPLVHDTLVVAEMSGKRVSFLDLFQVAGATAAARDERGMTVLRNIVGASVSKSTGVVELSITTEWRSVSMALAAALLDGVNDYNQRTRQGQAAVERKFVEGRLAVATAELQAAEDRLGNFLRTNRALGSSSELLLERDRLQRDVAFRQQLFASLTQAFEDVRIREVRDTPVITMFETPYAPPQPEPRGRLQRLLIGIVLGLVFGVMLALVSGVMALRRREGSAELEEFVGVLSDLRGDLLKPVGWVKRRPAS